MELRASKHCEITKQQEQHESVAKLKLGHVLTRVLRTIDMKMMFWCLQDTTASTTGCGCLYQRLVLFQLLVQSFKRTSHL